MRNQNWIPNWEALLKCKGSSNKTNSRNWGIRSFTIKKFRNSWNWKIKRCRNWKHLIKGWSRLRTPRSSTMRIWLPKCNSRKPSNKRFQPSNLLLSLCHRNLMFRLLSKLRRISILPTRSSKKKRTQSRRSDVSRGSWSKRWRRSTEKRKSSEPNKWAIRLKKRGRQA